MKKKINIILFVFVILSSSVLFLLPEINILSYNNYQNKKLDELSTSEQSESQNFNPNLIIYFKKSSFSNDIRNKFEFYGGDISNGKIWNETFSSFCGFTGKMSQETYNANISLFQNEYPTAIIERDEYVESQMNYASIQSFSFNSSAYINSYEGNTNSSIAVLDTGIDDSVMFLKDKVILNESFVATEPETNDLNGHGTFISSIIAGTGIDPYNSTSKTRLSITKNFTHSDYFDLDIFPQNYSIKLCTVNVSNSNENLIINSSWFNITEGIDDFWIQLFYEGELVNSSHNINQLENYIINHTIFEEEGFFSESNSGLYDIYVKYHVEKLKDPTFTISLNAEFIPEYYLENYSSFTGIANATKLINFKVLNQTGEGKVSNVISALEYVFKNKEESHIVSVCLSVGTLGTEITGINTVIDEICNNGTLVVIAAGNYGPLNSKTINTLGKNKNAIVVGAINDKDQVTSYSSKGLTIDGDIIKPDLVAPGGSKIEQHRSIISGTVRENDTTANFGTSISTAIVSAAINILIEAKWKNWSQWNALNTTKFSKILKSILLMTATETNQNREDDPFTDLNENNNRYAPSLYQEIINITHRAGLSDEHEGYGRLNIAAAIDALTKVINPNNTYNGKLASSIDNSLGKHAYARQVNLTAYHQYLFNLTGVNEDATFDLYLYSNESNAYGDPILLASSRRSFQAFDYLYFTPLENETNPILVIKAINGESSFTLNFTEVENKFDPELKIPEISEGIVPKNTTVLSLSEIEGDQLENNITLDRYKFYIEYFDNDTANVPPKHMYVYIKELSKNFSLTQESPQDINYTDGAIFSSKYIELPDNKTYHYRFYVKDGLRNSTLPEIQTEYFEIKIVLPQVLKTFPYQYSFNEGLDNWTLKGTGWDILTQTNQNDNRSRLFNNTWNAVYFGTFHNNPFNYTYQPVKTDEPLNGSFTSPFYNFTDLNENIEPIANIGLRTSINSGDSIELLVNVNGSGWQDTPLKEYYNVEKEWYIEKINLTEYIGDYVKFRFQVSLDDNLDFNKYKGFLIDYFSIQNYTNHSPPKLKFEINTNVKYLGDLSLQQIQFSLDYIDTDNNYPENVYLEIDNNNYSMINYFGDWNASSNSTEDIGINFVKTMCLNEISNKSFKFHISDGKYNYSTQIYNSNNSLFTFSAPDPLEYNYYQELIPIGFNFPETLENFYVCGTPIQRERTAWLNGDNTWHKVHKLYKDYLYGGNQNEFSADIRGYGQDWEANLITKPLNALSNKKVIFQYKYDIDLQYEASLDQEERDVCKVSISNDWGESWTSLKKYYYDSDGKGNETIDISEYVEDPIMIKFTLQSNDYQGSSPGFGWLLSDIYIGYDKTKDHVPPVISIQTPQDGKELNSKINIKANLTDNNNSLDISTLQFRIDGSVRSLSNYNFNNNTGILSFNLDTMSLSNGWHTLTIVVQDKDGNEAEVSVSIKVNNLLITLGKAMIWAICGIAILSVNSFLIYKGFRYIMNERNLHIVDETHKYRKKGKLRIKNLEEVKEAQSKYPLTLYCKYCDTWFYSDSKFDIMCPLCGHDQVFVAYNCINCGKWNIRDTPGEDYHCSRCGVKLLKRSKDIIQDRLIKEKEKALIEYKKEKKEFSILD
ncbi:MAG: hypothetical protein EU547_01510 [Promethearchaeota archaeon]|nr:MAG: hypothetical protein EU547_01510 [Candidatus Lokiarchaeota archaeon]